MKDLVWCIDQLVLKNKNILKNLYSTSIKKCEILNIETQMVSRNDDNSPTLVKPRK